MEFELVYDDVTIQDVNHYTRETPLYYTYINILVKQSKGLLSTAFEEVILKDFKRSGSQV